MSNNRTEQQALVSSLAATVDLTELQAALVQAGYVFKKDVATSSTVVGASTTISFATSDQHVVTITANCAISFSNLEDGQRAKLVVSKAFANLVTFIGANVSFGQQLGLTYLYFDVVKNNGVVIVTQTNNQSFSTLSAGEFSTSQMIIFFATNCNSIINNNIVNFSGYLDLTSLDIGGVDVLSIAIPTNRKLGTFKVLNQKMAGSAVITNPGNENMILSATIQDDGSNYIMKFKAASLFIDLSTWDLFFNFSVCIK